MENIYLTKFINRNIGRLWHELVADVNNEIEKIDRMNFKVQDPKVFSEYQMKDYRKHLMGFLFFLNHSKIPAGIEAKGLLLFKPLIESMQANGSLQIDVRELFG